MHLKKKKKNSLKLFGCMNLFGVYITKNNHEYTIEKNSLKQFDLF